MSQSSSTVVPAGSAALAAKQQRLADLESDLLKFEVAKIATGAILREIRDEALFLVAGASGSRAYADFASYCSDRWGIGEREVARRIEAADIVQQLVDAGVDPLNAPRNPWQARELSVLINATDVQTGVQTWQKALVDSQDPKINPAGQITGEFLKGYVTKALTGAGKARRQGTSRARPSSKNTGAQTPAPAQASQPSTSAPAAPVSPPAAPAVNGAVPSSQPSLQVAQPVAVDASVLADIAADVKARRMQLANPLARKPLFGGPDPPAAGVGGGAGQAGRHQRRGAGPAGGPDRPRRQVRGEGDPRRGLGGHAHPLALTDRPVPQRLLRGGQHPLRRRCTTARGATAMPPIFLTTLRCRSRSTPRPPTRRTPWA